MPTKIDSFILPADRSGDKIP